jgi:hypothetical protein
LLTLSLKVTFQLTLEAFVGFAFAWVMEDTVGAVVSQLTVVHETFMVYVSLMTLSWELYPCAV